MTTTIGFDRGSEIQVWDFGGNGFIVCPQNNWAEEYETEEQLAEWKKWAENQSWFHKERLIERLKHAVLGALQMVENWETEEQNYLREYDPKAFVRYREDRYDQMLIAFIRVFDRLGVKKSSRLRNEIIDSVLTHTQRWIVEKRFTERRIKRLISWLERLLANQGA